MARSNGKKYIGGGSTLEILIAFAILILCMTAVVMVGFGNQSVAVDAETEAEALSKAGDILENSHAQSRADFISVVAASSTTTSTIAYVQSLAVADLTACKKIATSTVSWNSG